MKTAKILFKSIRENKLYSWLSIIFVALESVCEAIIPFIISLLINEIEAILNTGSVSWNNFALYASLLVILTTISLVFGVLSGIYCARAGAGFSYNLRLDMFKKIQGFSFENIDKFQSSSLITRMTTDVVNVQNAFTTIIRIVIRVPLMIVFSVVMAFVVNASLAWIFLLCIPTLGGVIIFIFYKVYPLFKKIFNRYDSLNNSIHENIKGIRVVKTYVREEYEKQKFAKESDNIAKNFIKAEKIIALMNPINSFFFWFCYSLMAILGAYLSIGLLQLGGVPVTYGELSSLIIYGVNVLGNLTTLFMIIVIVGISITSSKRIVEVLQEESTLHNPENPVYEVKDGSIEFNNVNFSYVKDSEKFALSNINLKINSGETIGIIGDTGSSKTSFINLISRLYDVTNGNVKVGGIDVKEYDLDTLRKNVAVVLQKNVLFSGTIEENMRWGDEKATLEEIIEACKISQADEFVSRFPDQYNTYLEESGTNLSGGQKQRLCIARALLRRPKILILDDSTSAVDTKTDSLIRTKLKEYIPSTTKIIISQRISSIEDADKIIVINKGEIDAFGNHKELLKTNSIYKEIYAIQNRIGGKKNETASK
ncbi:ABC transporter ATP-binding protein [Malacoplasma penetrans]|uniref:ABC transporter ATP-binding protein n=1 Tax=Malacoplasma penetrans TaxID=28227 RepID=UPI001013AA4E|nr:ABC transporter ATP-binding protein [Malacoplasma penetrans]RXY96207.1 ABC transporter ATP-binding protein [Malacoplasma penetrans]